MLNHSVSYLYNFPMKIRGVFNKESSLFFIKEKTGMGRASRIPF
jgi:hypothetical protein